MFGWFKNRSVAVQQARNEMITLVAEDSANFMINLKAALGQLPRRMVDDPFVIGGVTMYAAISAKVLTKGQANNAFIESAMVSAIERTFADQGVTRHEAISTLMRFKNNPEYARAVQVFSLILGARYQRSGLIHDPLIVEARNYMLAVPEIFRMEFGATEAEQVAYEITRRHFVEPIKERYGELWR